MQIKHHCIWISCHR